MTVREEIIQRKRPPITFTPDEAVAILNSLEPGNAPEAHSIADDAILRVLQRSGGHEVVAAFRAAEDRCGFWDGALELESIARTLASGKEPHAHARPGFWDGFDPTNEVFARWVERGEIGPNGECFVCQARLRAQALNL